MTSGAGARAVLLSISTWSLVVGCTSIVPEPVKPCESALECTEIVTRRDASCKTAFPGASEDSFWLTNNSPTRRIFTAYEESVRHPNSPQQPSSVQKMLSVDPGKQLSLGCWRTRGMLEGRYDEYAYKIVTTCFADQCPAPPPQKPAKTRDPRTNCTDLCDQGDASCIVADTRYGGGAPYLTGALEKMNRSVSTSPLPAQVDMSALANLVNVTNNNTDCKRTPLELMAGTGAVGSFSNTGSTCQLTMQVQASTLDGFKLAFPGKWLGQFQRKGNGFEMGTVDLTETPWLHVHDKATGLWESDPVVGVTGRSKNNIGSWTFTADKYYCARVQWPTEFGPKKRK